MVVGSTASAACPEGLTNTFHRSIYPPATFETSLHSKHRSLPLVTVITKYYGTQGTQKVFRFMPRLAEQGS